ncbi:MAG: hypothetical protein IIA45_06280, partial [Bacteroidetes bacterium]|nr:hypothetical protein [Bacteroidota bacterium]
MEDSNNKNLKIHKDFTKLFKKRERKELLGKLNINLWILSMILFFTFSAIGFAIGSLKYLGSKMDNSFINGVDIVVPYDKADDIALVKNELNENDTLKDKYFYKNVTGYYRYSLRFKDMSKNGTKECIGRTMDIRNPLLSELFSSKNHPKGKKFNDSLDVGLIVRKQFLEDFNYDKDASFVFMSIPTDSSDMFVPIPISAIVDELPGSSLFISTPYFFSQRKKFYTDNPFNPNHTKDLNCFILGDETTGYVFKDSIESFFQGSLTYHVLDPFVSPQPIIISAPYISGYKVKISFNKDLAARKLSDIFEVLKNSAQLNPFPPSIQLYDYKFTPVYEYDKFDKLSVNFNDLDKIAEFKKYINSQYDLTIDMGLIEEKENYNFVSKLTKIISFILIAFGILSICIFIYNILNTHLNKIKKNIGTFLAFGIDERKLKMIYMSILLRFIGITLITSIMLASVYGY